MFGFSPKLPISDEDRQWADEGFRRLEKLLGRRRMIEARVITPTAEDFPDPYDKNEPQSAEKIFARVCTYMQVDRRAIEFEIFPDETEELREILPFWRGTSGKHAAGLYLHAMEERASAANDDEKEHAVVAIRSSQLKDPLSLVATIAHELGHVILLGGGLMAPKTPDHEPMTDLLTVYLGLGIFNANSAGRFRQYQDERRAGWSMQRLGYLPEEIFGYALAKFSVERGEDRIEWERHLSANVRSYFNRSRRWLAKNPHGITMAKPIS
ncbi:MAG TPA: hypothetical protein VJ999_12780 [Candidatus Sulfotelmatobacter sp.]|nr:hypothetical protein [Candidatus Sulfotelmatobacter sp.]